MACPLKINGRGERIRTSDPLVPNQVLYQAEPLPDKIDGHGHWNHMGRRDTGPKR